MWVLPTIQLILTISLSKYPRQIHCALGTVMTVLIRYLQHNLAGRCAAT
jgi:hypothetical protein